MHEKSCGINRTRRERRKNVSTFQNPSTEQKVMTSQRLPKNELIFLEFQKNEFIFVESFCRAAQVSGAGIVNEEAEQICYSEFFLFRSYRNGIEHGIWTFHEVSKKVWEFFFHKKFHDFSMMNTDF